MGEDKKLEIENLYKRFFVKGKEINILNNINLTINQGEFITIVGHSGCGKSTLLKIICGLETLTEGSIKYGGKQLKGPDTTRGMVFQEHRLLPWLSIEENVGFGLFNYSKEEKEKLVNEHIDLVKLTEFKDAYPSQLSGGMSQRAAIARGLVNNPEILLLDEPFGALDALTRIQMQKEILKIWEKQKTTMIMVTHDIDEAIYLGERIIVLSSRPGEIKDIIKVSQGVGRVRGSADFARIKKKIYKYFFEDEQEFLEDYVI